MAHVAHVVRNRMNSGLYPSPRHHGGLNGLALSLGTTNSLRADVKVTRSASLQVSFSVSLSGLFLGLSLSLNGCSKALSTLLQAPSKCDYIRDRIGICDNHNLLKSV